MKKRGQLPSYYPIFLNIDGKKCVVVGGGQVALRKVKALLEHNASVEMISPDFCSELNQLIESGEIHVLRRSYQAGDLQNAFIVIAATDDSAINLAVVKEAQRRAILANVVDDADNSDFILPSYLRRGDITIAVSTAGRSPALARKIRTRLEESFGAEYSSLALLIGEVRADIKQQGINVNSDTWQEAINPDLLIDLIKNGNKKEAKAVLLSNLKTGQK